MFWKKKKSRLEILRDTVADRAHDALESAHHALESAQGAWHQASDILHDTLEHAPEKLEDLRETTGGTLSGAVSRVQDAVSGLGAKADTAKKGVREAAHHAGEMAHDRVEDARHLLDEKRHLLDKMRAQKQRAAEKSVADAKGKARELAASAAPEVVITDGTQKWVWLGVGILIGAAIGILLAPSSGRRNRALLRDRLAKSAHKAEGVGESMSRHIHDISNRAEGAAHNVAARIHAKIEGTSDDADDVTIADRVRASLGHLPEAKSLERINVESCDGVVTLRGPVVDAKTQDALIAATQKVPGVREVVSDLLVEDDTEETFIG